MCNTVNFWVAKLLSVLKLKFYRKIIFSLIKLENIFFILGCKNVSVAFSIF